MVRLKRCKGSGPCYSCISFVLKICRGAGGVTRGRGPAGANPEGGGSRGSGPPPQKKTSKRGKNVGRVRATAGRFST